MTVQTYYLKQGDLLPAASRTLELDGKAINIDGWQGVAFHMRAQGATEAKINAAATVIDAEHGIVEYQWKDDDTDTVGEFDAEWEATDALGRPITFPNAPGDDAETELPHDRVLISEELA